MSHSSKLPTPTQQSRSLEHYGVASPPVQRLDFACRRLNSFDATGIGGGADENNAPIQLDNLSAQTTLDESATAAVVAVDGGVKSPVSQRPQYLTAAEAHVNATFKPSPSDASIVNLDDHEQLLPDDAMAAQDNFDNPNFGDQASNSTGNGGGRVQFDASLGNATVQWSGE